MEGRGSHESRGRLGYGEAFRLDTGYAISASSVLVNGQSCVSLITLSTLYISCPSFMFPLKSFTHRTFLVKGENSLLCTVSTSYSLT